MFLRIGRFGKGGVLVEVIRRSRYGSLGIVNVFFVRIFIIV